MGAAAHPERDPEKGPEKGPEQGRKKGRFITFEGGEGAGKSTQLRRLVGTLEATGITAIATREPGGAPAAEEIRALLVSGAPERWHPLSEALLVNAARNEHLERLIRPALAAGEWVVCDRFTDSTTAYQGIARGLGWQVTDTLAALVVRDTRPDLTIILDVPAEIGLARASARQQRTAGGGDRYERFDMAFHETLRRAFLDIAKAEPDRCVVIDATQDEDKVAAQVRAVVAARLGVAFHGG